MMEALWLASVLAAQLWGAGGLDDLGEVAAPREDHRTPIEPPIAPGVRALCDSPPDEAEVLRTMPPCRAIPFLYEEFRDNIEIVTEKLVDKVDPPRFFPLVGPAQLHHCHWKCTVYFTETIDSSYPFPFHTKTRRIELVYIDKDFLHLCVENKNKANDGPSSAAPARMPVETGCQGGPNPRPRRAEATDTVVINAIRLEGKQRPLDESALKNICYEHMVRADGTISLGLFGSVYVAGMTTGQIRCVVEKHLSPYIVDPQVLVELKGYSSGKIYVIKMNGDGQCQDVVTLPGTDKLSVVEALAQVKDLLPATKIWVSRPSPNGRDQFVKLPVDVKELVQSGRMPTNYELVAGDRLYVMMAPKTVSIGDAEESSVPERSRQVTLADVVRLSKRGIAEDIIIRQMELTGSVFSLTVEDILSLNEQGVSDNIIRAMQGRLLTPTSQLTPYRVHGGVGPASSAIE